MNPEKCKKILGILGWVTLGLAIIACLSLAITSVHIYKTEGDSPFSRKTVAEHSWGFMPQLILAALSVILTGVFSLAFPTPEERLKAPKNNYAVLARLKKSAKKDMPSLLNDEQVKGEYTYRVILRSILAFIILVFTVFTVIFAADLSKYHLEDINGDILSVCLVILPHTVGVILCGLAVAILCSKSAAREAELIKSLLKSDTTGADGTDGQEYKLYRIISILGKIGNFFENKLVINIIRGVILCTAITFVVIGIINGGMSDVLGKAVRICTECIGLG